MNAIKFLGPDSQDMRYDVQRIFTKTPHNKQVMMFSATLSDEIRDICKRFMHNPREIIIDEGKNYDFMDYNNTMLNS